jgi:hypothetical protein
MFGWFNGGISTVIEGSERYSDLSRDFGGGEVDTSGLSRVLSISRHFGQLSRFFVDLLGPGSVFSGAANTSHNFGNVLRTPVTGAGDLGFTELRAMVESGPPVLLPPGIGRQRLDGPVIDCSSETSIALRSYFAGERAQFKRSAPSVPNHP